MTEPTVVALVVTRGLTPYLRRTVSALLSQTHRPEKIIVVNTAKSLLEPIPGLEILQVPNVKTYGEAVQRSIDALPVLDRVDWLWFLHDDSAPELDCLELLLEATKAGLTTAVVGPKQVAWSDSDRILEVGIKATRSGRRLEIESADEIDQGQYDDISDVLAVGTAGMLVKNEIWQETGGLDTFLTPFGDGLEFCRRVRLGGHRVVVVPQAKLAHARLSYRDLRTDTVPDTDGSFKARRVAQLYNGLLLTSGLKLFLTLLGLPLWTLLRTLGRLLQKRLDLAYAEVAAFTTLYANLSKVFVARHRVKCYAKVPVSTLKSLEATQMEVNRHKRVQSRKERRLIRSNSLEPIAAGLLKRHRSVNRLVASTGFTLFAIASILFTRDFATGISGGAWANLPDSYSSLFWQAWSGWNLGGIGTPGPVDTLLPVFSVLTAPLALFGITPHEQLNFFWRLSPALIWISMYWGSRVITHRWGWRLLLALLWVGSPTVLISWSEGRLATLLVAVALPLFMRAWLHTSAHVVPLYIRGAFTEEISIFDSSRSFQYPALATLALLVLTGAAPWLTLLLVPLVIGVAIFTPQRRLTQLMLSLPAAVFLIPLWIHFVTSSGKARWQVLFADTVSGLAFAQANTWEIGLGLPQDHHSLSVPFAQYLPEVLLPYLTFAWLVPGVVIFVGAGLALFNLQRWVLRARIAFLVGVLATGAAVLTSRIIISEGGELIYGWAGIGILLATLCWMLASAGSIPNLVLQEYLHSYRGRRRLEKSMARRMKALRKRPRKQESGEQPSAGGNDLEHRIKRLDTTTLKERSAYRFQALTALVIFALALVPALLWFPQIGTQPQVVKPAPRYLTPATTVEAQLSERSAKFLLLNVTDQGVEASLLRGDGKQLADSTPLQRWNNAQTVLKARVGADFNITKQSAPAQQALATAVTELLTAPDTTDGSKLLEFGIDEVALSVNDSLARETALLALEQSPILKRAGEAGAGSLWRLRPFGLEPSRAYLKIGQKYLPIADPTLGPVELPAEAANVESLLILAEPKHSGWNATLNGAELTATDYGWQQAYAVPAEAGQLRMSWYADWLPVWWLAATASLLGMLIGAIPVNGRGRTDVE
ncbi:putative ATP synthase F0, A subunit [Gleimia coleocanis DSM 15436]|uniref:Putative ATP synthase F0, A subunit n=1 Tax=Gleimia coleocanis DSM 15436 TaxID=525245 RepID=C0VZV4_9ACTO|nr:glycosyltransferase [Gleimia coleocanis]EEH63813.1 putative ATP synthase F0, A subunit [Gleimia coleocanis DSM 15436]